MSRYIFDIETDGLLRTCTRCWIIAAYDLDSRKMQYWEEGDEDWKEVFSNAKLLAGHNVLGYDFAALEKIFKWKPNPKTKIQDTLIMSQVLNYNRFESGSHSLEAWGEALGQPKQEHEDWSKYSEEMKQRCLTDVMLNVRVYNNLMAEFKESAENYPNLRPYMAAEHAVAKWCSQAELHGWPFDINSAKSLFEKMDAELTATRDKLMPKLGMKCVAVDKLKGEVEAKTPKWKKDGFYAKTTSDWFEIDPILGLLEEPDRIISGPYSRVEFKHLDLNSIQDVKVFLFRNGWVPTEWNWKSVYNPDTDRTEKVKMAPKITEDSLEFLEGDGKLYLEFLTTKSRHSILKTWINECDSNGRLHGECFTIGTPSMRARHSIIVNVPSADAPWGKEMRKLFTCPPGWKLIGCDSAGNQARGLAHYLKSQEFTNQLLNGDIHQYNANVLTEVLKEMGVSLKCFDGEKVPRSSAKRILYAFLFGASGSKLWSYIFGNLDDKKGKHLKNGFTKAVPGFKELLGNLEKAFGATSKNGKGYIRGLAGNRIYCDSFHKLLVYLLQAAEKATCSAAVMLTMQRLEEEGIPYQPCIMMHDEEDFIVPEEFAERAAEIGKQAFKDGPKLFGVEIMDGDAKIGDNWYEVH